MAARIAIGTRGDCQSAGGFGRAPHIDGLVPAANLMAYTFELGAGLPHE